VSPLSPSLRVTSTCQGPFRLALTARHLAVACLFGHAVALFARDASGAPTGEVARITHDGPLWSVALLEHGDELVVGAGGVEDHPLERRDGVFGYIDSFAYLYVLEPDGSLERRRAVNTSALGVVLPKAVTLRERDGAPELLALGYATAPLLALTLPATRAARGGRRSLGASGERPRGKAPNAASAPLADELEPSGARTLSTALPGCNELVTSGDRLLCANPLFDAWVELEPSGPRLHPARAAAPNDPDPNTRLGEALFFTTLMAPDARSDGRLSRFTCETCHFEGTTDGRVHDSGRHAFDSAEDVRVSTRPLRGLFNDAPFFSRAHDRDLTSVCQNEFAVVNRGNPVEPWFSLATDRFPWLRALGERRARLAPGELRRALLQFLSRFTHEENPFAAAHEPPGRFTPRERHGAELFREHCERCHAARLVANDPATLVPFERWETLVFSPAAPIVWARGDYEKTGVLPYVDREGTRIPSLRRLYLKRPYFTNGSAGSLADVLERARSSAGTFRHDDPAPSGALDAGDRLALLDFLRLL
jgi:cytochrome c peroxidase